MQRELGLVDEAVTIPAGLFSEYRSIRSGQGAVRREKKGSKRYVEVVGSPDLVVEVVSESSVKKDTVRLRKLYQKILCSTTEAE